MRALSAAPTRLAFVLARRESHACCSRKQPAATPPPTADGPDGPGVGVIAEIQRAASASDSATKSGLRPPTRSTRRK